MKSSNKLGIILVLFLIIVGVGFIVYNNVNVDKENKLNDKKKEKIIINENSDYNIRLIKEINKNEKGNYLISPYSIKVALNMLSEGANNETEEEIVNLVGSNSNRINPIKNRINDANAIFIKDKYKKIVEKDFINTIKDDYKGEVLFDEFITPEVINKWVEKQTYEMIPNLLDRIPNYFVLGLANAVAIDVEWQEQFDCHATKKDKFELIDDSTKRVSMMSHTYNSGAKYFLNDDYKGVILPYVSYDKNGKEDYKSGEQLEFVGIIPDGNVTDFVNNMDDNFLVVFDKDAKTASRKENLFLKLPVFSYEYSVEKFKEVLQNLGVRNAFDSEKADFTKIISEELREKNNMDNIYVDEAIHKTYIELSESGTKAAAVTYFGVLEASSMEKEEPKVIEIEFDKPFVYMIRDKKNKELLFFGVVYEPNDYKERKCE